jgi:hypothetical protein
MAQLCMEKATSHKGCSKPFTGRQVQRRRHVQVKGVGSTYGSAFRVTTFGESHGKGVGCIIDGVPPRLNISEEEIQLELDRRRPGQSIITTPRKEEDRAEILSGVYNGVTLGTPIAIVVRNKDQKSQDYTEMSVAYRPSHADATYDFKYGIRAVAGGGRSSARETIGRVAAGAVAKKLLKVVAGTEVRGTWFGTPMTNAIPVVPSPACAASRVLLPVLPTLSFTAWQRHVQQQQQQHPLPLLQPCHPYAHSQPAAAGRAGAGVCEPGAGRGLRGGPGELHDGGRGEQHRALPRPGGCQAHDRR